jgi:hypothetical protein
MNFFIWPKKIKITLEPITPFGTLDIIGKALMSTHCRMALLLGEISPSGDPKNGALQSLQTMFSLKIGTNSAYFKEKKVKFATFRPWLFRMSPKYCSRVPKYFILSSIP